MIKKQLQLAILIFVLAVAGACSSGSSEGEKALEGNDFLVTIKTDMGEMKAILYDKTPKHKENFLKLVREGFYDSLLFHRVIQNFMIQGGDPDSKNAAQGVRLGMGGPGYTVPAEFVPELIHEKGALSAARLGGETNPQKASSGSQFYIVQGQVIPRTQLEGDNQGLIFKAFTQLMQDQPEHALAVEYQAVINNNPNDNKAIQVKVNATLERLSEATSMTFTMAKDRIDKYSTIGGTPHLDDDYTVFGKVIQGLDILDKIAAAPAIPALGDRPVEDIRMFVSVEELPKKEIAEKYGNPYLQ